MKAIEKAQGHCIITEFQLHQKENFYTYIPIMQKEYDLAKDWLATFDAPLRALDAIHMAVAHTNSLTLITADSALAKACKTFGVPAKKI
jgi:predicted nucleic acid-binding protein